MKLHNTLTKKVDGFHPMNAKTVNIYSCGPTVYNYAHIGNLSSYIYADILRRTVKLSGYEVHHVMNLTDVDDKTIRDSHLEFPDDEPMTALKKLTTKYSQIFIDEMREIGNEIGTDLDAGETFRDGFNLTRATNNIDGIQNLVRKLLCEKIAYVADDGIYFSIAEYQKTRKYGQLSDISVGNSRIDNDEYSKENAQDFALWKRQKPGEPAWNFDFSDLDESEILWTRELQNHNKIMLGRPGWHIECSVMSTRFLGQPFDIHTGGIDLIFPHHENEIAQSTAGDQPEKLANFFVHNEHLLVDGKKMSKSARNFYTLADIKKRGFSALDFRMFVLQSHYRSATNFSWENLASAKNRLINWKNFANLRWQNINSADDNDFTKLLNQTREALLNGLDTPNALAKLEQIFAKNLSREQTEKLIAFVDENLGLKLRETTPDISVDEKALIKNRESARREKNWLKSDELRDELLNQHGIFVKDAPTGTIWSRD